MTAFLPDLTALRPGTISARSRFYSGIGASGKKVTGWGFWHSTGGQVAAAHTVIADRKSARSGTFVHHLVHHFAHHLSPSPPSQPTHRPSLLVTAQSGFTRTILALNWANGPFNTSDFFFTNSLIRLLFSFSSICSPTHLTKRPGLSSAPALLPQTSTSENWDIVLDSTTTLPIIVDYD
ncbi:hypothetical protein PT974_08805 [Cladobotryum mycophilum]|uniref:Uncharacterized protein n=1 Tax=Cladobotryum mycophilum TaxID=491253 RepID=A0ABR0SEI3_9HYPO